MQIINSLLSPARLRQGQSIIELVVGLIVLVPVLLVLLDLAIVVMAVQTNDSAARDAARAAASGRPVDFTQKSGAVLAADSLSRAQAVMARYKSSSGGYLVGPELVGGSNVSDADPNSGPQNVTPPNASFGGAYTGTYRVTTQMVVNLPAYIPGLTPQKVPLRSRQEFPVTRQDVSSGNSN